MPITEGRASTASPRLTQWIKRGTIAIGLMAAIAVCAPFIASLLPNSSAVSNPMLTHTIAPGKMFVTVTADGTLESSSNKEIKCKVRGGGTVLWVVETGTVVQPGDELVRLDTSSIEDNISQQQIAYENALANKIITAASDARWVRNAAT